MLDEHKRTISIRSNFREWNHVLLVNVAYSHLHMFLRTWREQRPSNQGDFDSSVTGEVGTLLHGDGPASGFMCTALHDYCWAAFQVVHSVQRLDPHFCFFRSHSWAVLKHSSNYILLSSGTLIQVKFHISSSLEKAVLSLLRSARKIP